MLPIIKGDAFTETPGKQPGFDSLPPAKLEFYRNKCLSQLICTLLYLVEQAGLAVTDYIFIWKWSFLISGYCERSFSLFSSSPAGKFQNITSTRFPSKPFTIHHSTSIQSFDAK
jgi:hypothetical protein